MTIAPDNTYNTPNRMLRGGGIFEVTGEIRMQPGGKITNQGVQTAVIAAPTDLPSSITAITAIIAALAGVGIIV